MQTEPRTEVGALDGLRVIDLSAYLPGPYATMLLADLGADVIAVEPPGGEAGRSISPRVADDSALHSWVGRNKRCVVLDLKADTDYARLLSLIGGADVIVEGFTPGVADRLRVDYDTCRTIRPTLIYCSVSAHGQEGTAIHSPAHDINVLARAGFLDQVGLSRPGHGGSPGMVGPPVADLSAGLHAAVAILAAVHHRDQTGEGQFIDVTLLGAAVAMAGPQLVKALAPQPLPREHDHNLGADPAYMCYQAADGQWFALGSLELKFWLRLCEALERPDLAEARTRDPQLVTQQLATLFATADRDHWSRLLGPADVCYSPVNTIDAVVSDPLIRAHEGITSVGPARQPANPIRMSGTPLRPPSPAPLLSTSEVEWQ
jgi:alpha-methylacyl-CoA racemase